MRCSVCKSSQGYGCCCGRFVPAPNESCAPSPNRVKTVCVMSSRSCCCRPRVCRKSARCEPSPCTTSIRSCGGGRCCGGCGKPGQICTSSPRICNSLAHSSRGRSPCAPRCPPQPSCSISGCRSFYSGPNNCRRYLHVILFKFFIMESHSDEWKLSQSWKGWFNFQSLRMRFHSFTVKFILKF